jgi:putative transposase
MYRPRVEVPGAVYHVGSRGNNKAPVFLDDADRQMFLRMLGRTAKRHGWTVHAYCLLTNHYHLIVQLDAGGLSRGMCELNGGYALSFNVRRDRSNHVFGRRFWDKRIDTESHYFEACRYVALNALRAGLETRLGDWPWNSHRAIVGLEFPLPFLSVHALLGRFGPTPSRARDAYIRHVTD